MQITQFNGGLATRIDPSLIGPSSAIICNNVDTSSVVLKSAKDINMTNTSMSRYFYKFNGVFYSSNNYRDYLEYRDALYFTEPSTRPKKVKAGVETNIGIDKPEATLAFNDSGAPIFDQAGSQYKGIVPIVQDFQNSDINYAFASNANGDLPAATYNYRFGIVQNGVVVRYIDAAYTTSSTGAITITFQPLGGLTINVYREYSGTYHYIGQLRLSELRVVSDTVENISAFTPFFAISDLNVAFSNVAGGNLTAATYNYRFAITYNSQVFDYVNKTFTSSGTQSVKLTFEALGGSRIFIYREYSGTYRYLGAVTLTADNTTFIDSILDISGNTAFVQTGITYGVIQYTMTYYNNNTGVESAPMLFSSEITVQLGKRVRVTKIPLAIDPQVTHRRIYRIGGNLTQMSLVKELDDNTTTSFYDYTDDVYATSILESYDYLPPPTTIKYLVEAYGILFAADGKDLVFSMQGFPEYWPASNRINFDAEITGLQPTPNGLLVSTLYKTWIIVGTDVSNFAKLIVTEEQGCVNHKTFKMVKNMPVWVSLDGYCSLSNGLVTVISKDLLGKQYFNIADCVVYDEMYMLALADGSMHMLDVRFNPNYTTYSFAKNIISMGVFEDILYCVSDENKLGTIFEGSLMSFTYKTGKYVEESHSMTKGYNNIYVRADGDFTFKVIIDDVLVQTVTLTGNKVHDVGVPQEKQRGSGIQFEVSGVGTIYEIEYKVLGRQNGR